MACGLQSEGLRGSDAIAGMLPLPPLFLCATVLFKRERVQSHKVRSYRHLLQVTPHS